MKIAQLILWTIRKLKKGRLTFFGMYSFGFLPHVMSGKISLLWSWQYVWRHSQKGLVHWESILVYGFRGIQKIHWYTEKMGSFLGIMAIYTIKSEYWIIGNRIIVFLIELFSMDRNHSTTPYKILTIRQVYSHGKVLKGVTHFPKRFFFCCCLCPKGASENPAKLLHFGKVRKGRTHEFGLTSFLCALGSWTHCCSGEMMDDFPASSHLPEMVQERDCQAPAPVTREKMHVHQQHLPLSLPKMPLFAFRYDHHIKHLCLFLSTTIFSPAFFCNKPNQITQMY